MNTNGFIKSCRALIRKYRRITLVGLICFLPGPVACAAPSGHVAAKNQDRISAPAFTAARIAYTIQVGAFSSIANAIRLAEKLRAAGCDAYYFIDTDQLHKVRLGRFSKRSRATSKAHRLKADGHIDDFFIARPGRHLPAPIPDHGLRADIVKTARRFVGIPYRFGGESVKTGFDCSGLTMTVYRLNGIALPRHSRTQFDNGRPISLGTIQQGDLVFFAMQKANRISHVGVYLGQGKFIHAPGKGKQVRISSLSSRYFKKRYMGARTYF